MTYIVHPDGTVEFIRQPQGRGRGRGKGNS